MIIEPSEEYQSVRLGSSAQAILNRMDSQDDYMGEKGLLKALRDGSDELIGKILSTEAKDRNPAEQGARANAE